MIIILKQVTDTKSVFETFEVISAAMQRINAMTVETLLQIVMHRLACLSIRI